MTYARSSSVARTTLPTGADTLGHSHALPWYLWVARAPLPVPAFTMGARRTGIGRDAVAGVDLVLPDPTVSRLHAALQRLPGEDTLWLQDCASSNGVFLNGRRVDGAPARSGDVIRLGDSVLVVGRGALAPPGEARDLGILGQSPPVAELRSVVRKVAPSTLPLLIVGPTGTGKELVARAAHAESGRCGRFVAVNCAALPEALVESALFGHKKGAYTGAVADQEGAFVQADGGTLFLDEVGDLALGAQPKLLRALENGEVTPVGATHPVTVDVRVVAATLVPLDAALESACFRRDLYARLAGVIVKTPALAQHREDVLLLFDSFLGEADARPMTADFVESLLVHGWPFNVRELRKLAERLALLHAGAPCWERGMLDEDMLPRAPSDAREPSAGVWERPHRQEPGEPRAEARAGGSAVRGTEPPAPRESPPARDVLIALLEKCDGNVSKVAELVRRNRKQVYRWMKQHAVEPGTGRTE